MHLLLENITKSYQRKKIIENFSFQFNSGESYAVSGSNGSGKTTLLKIMMGFAKPDNGKVFFKDDKGKTTELVFSDFSFAGIQEVLFDDLPVRDIVKFHFSLRKSIEPKFNDQFEKVFSQGLYFKKANQLSAGWLNRLKLMLAIFTQSKVLILDEPFSNMDDQGIGMMQDLLNKFLNNRTLIVAGNREDEISICQNRIWLESIGTKES